MNLRDYQSKKIRHWVDNMLIISKEGLLRPVINAYKQHYGINYMNHIKATLQTQTTDYAPDTFMSDDTLLSAIDAYSCFQLMLRRWKYLFHAKLGKAGKSRVQQLVDLRNDWAHEKPILLDNARLAAEAALHLLKDFYVEKEADLMRELLQELQRIHEPDNEEETSTARPVSLEPLPDLPPVNATNNDEKIEPETTAFQPISLNGNYHLTIVTPGGETRYVPVPVEVDRISVGRGNNNDITVKDDGVSREHLMLMKNEKDEMTIVDLNSRNGTTVDGQRLTPNTPKRWFPGTKVIIGGSWLILRREADK